MKTNRIQKTAKLTRRLSLILLTGAVALAGAVWLSTGGASVSHAQGGLRLTVNSTGDGSGFSRNSCDVNPFLDGDQCTLRAALQLSNFSLGADSIGFSIPSSDPNCNASGQCVINLTEALPSISDDVNISGPGAERLTVRGETGGNYVIFYILAPGIVNISGLTLEDAYRSAISRSGSSLDTASELNISNCIIRNTRGPGIRDLQFPGQDGGAVFIESPGVFEVNISDTMIIDNGVRGVFSQDRVAPYFHGVTNITRSTISRNRTAGNGGGVYSIAHTNVINSTISENSAYDVGAGILNAAGSSFFLSVANSTVIGNSVGGTESSVGAGIKGPVQIFSSIVVGNFRVTPGNPTSDVDFPDSEGHNLIGTATPSFTPAEGDQIGVTPDQVNLGPLQDNGGPTWTHQPGSGSVALDKGAANSLPTDQRGLQRTVDDPDIPNETGGDGTDVGSVEVFVDPDDDDDGVLDVDDNCPLTPNPDQADTDNDSQGDACDADDDNDGVEDANDNCTLAANPDQTDTDSDGFGNSCDADDDNDGVEDSQDAFPLDPNETTDTDGDGTGNSADTDDDNDGVADTADNCPLTANSDQADFDLDGVGDTCDLQTGPPTSREQCRNGGWIRFNFPRQFNNQGDCLRFFATGN